MAGTPNKAGDQASKKRKLDDKDGNGGTKGGQPSSKRPIIASGFIIDDSDDESANEVANEVGLAMGSSLPTIHGNLSAKEPTNAGSTDEFPEFPEFQEFQEFPDIEDWPLDDKGFDGPENREIRCSQQYSSTGNLEESIADNDETDRKCPICNGNMADLTEEEVTVHVNNCLDGKPTPLSNPGPKSTRSVSPQTLIRRPSAIMKPVPKRWMPSTPTYFPAGRDSGLLGGPSRTGGDSGIAASAFSKLMAKPEETVGLSIGLSTGLSVGSSVTASRNQLWGKGNGGQRACPFYKKIAGFSITVDAFCYGAIDGCNAYFLTHFHSDHYVGLGSGWSHGPIYCSQATANLAKQRLNVGEKWLVPLEFEKQREIPNTNGATVVMISANHCPGSSMFLFEKPATGLWGKKVRILHCGDFRACKTHITHPLLKPQVKGVLTGDTVQQRIDSCYLDTTYLNPKYSFPPQEQVIRVCAELCTSIQADLPERINRRGKKKGEQVGTITRFLTITPKPKLAAAVAEPSKPISQPVNPFTITSGLTKPLNPPKTPQRRARPYIQDQEALKPSPSPRLLVVCGVYSIGKERLAIGIARSLSSKIYASPAKRKILAALNDEDLNELMTENPHEAQVHLETANGIRRDALKEYLGKYKDDFVRVVGFKPTGWTFGQDHHRKPGDEEDGRGKGKGKDIKGRYDKDKDKDKDKGKGKAKTWSWGPEGEPVEKATPQTLSIADLLHDNIWQGNSFSTDSLLLRRPRPRTKTRSRGGGSVDEKGEEEEEAVVMIFPVPYSEHSSFRDLALFVMGLDIAKVIPTVNVGNEEVRARMKGWVDKWIYERKRGGFVTVRGEEDEDDGEDGKGTRCVRWER